VVSAPLLVIEGSGSFSFDAGVVGIVNKCAFGDNPFFKKTKARKAERSRTYERAHRID
jgi:hypothetical protein